MIPQARLDEIQRWLRETVSTKAALDRMRVWDADSSDGEVHVNAVREFLAKSFRDGDELWEYDTGGDSWENLAGEMGYAIVRDSQVVDFCMLIEN